MRGHKLSPTCVALSRDDKTAYTGGKDCSFIHCMYYLQYNDFIFLVSLQYYTI